MTYISQIVTQIATNKKLTLGNSKGSVLVMHINHKMKPHMVCEMENHEP